MTQDEWLATLPLSWWREYMRGAYEVYAQLEKRPITKSDKRALFHRLKYSYVILGGVGSFTALAIMEYTFKNKAVLNG